VPSSVRSLFRAAGLDPEVPVRWGERATVGLPGVYLVALGEDADTTEAASTKCPLSSAALAAWLTARPELTLDRRRPSTDELAERLAAFWLPDEVALYIGKATTVSSRLDQYYSTPLGARTPHAGGYFLKTLSNLDDLSVFYAECAEPVAAEDTMLATFCAGVSATALKKLHDPDRPFPFANLEWPHGTRKRHGLKGAKAERRPGRPSTPPDPTPRDTAPAQTRVPRRATTSTGAEQTQPVTDADLRFGRIRIPRASKRHFPSERSDVDVELRGVRRRCRYDPRLGPDQERSGVLLVGKQTLADVVGANEVLSIKRADDVIRLS
jgi:hypothetical protein